jgi:P-type conjugative transfer protein TrbJ
MKRLFLFVALFSLTGVVSIPAHAQWLVIDPANVLQSTLTALRSLTQIQNQIQQLANETVMLENEARNLKGLNFSTLNRLLATLQTTNQLINQAQGLGFNLLRAEEGFAQGYPTAYPNAVSNAQMAQDAHQRWSNSLEALRTSIAVQSQAQTNFASDQASLTDLVNQSQSAVGALQATQATNQLLALHARQMIAEQQLRITQDRAVALEAARAIAAEERAREVRAQFNATGVPYTPSGSFVP